MKLRSEDGGGCMCRWRGPAVSRIEVMRGDVSGVFRGGRVAAEGGGGEFEKLS